MSGHGESESFQAHVTDEWERGGVVVQVRQRGTVPRIGVVLADEPHTTDGVPQLMFLEYQPDTGEVSRRTWHTPEGEDQTLEHPTPGLRLPWDAAYAVWQALGEAVGTPAPQRAAELADAVQRATDAEMALSIAQEKIHGLERLTETLRHQADLHAAALASERETVTLERTREAEVRGQLRSIATAYNELQTQVAAMRLADVDPPPVQS